jgi:hypothetical protein
MEQNIAIATALAAEIRHQQQLQEITNNSTANGPTTATMTKSSGYNNNSLVTLREIILKQHLQQFKGEELHRPPPDEELPTNLTLRPKDFSRLKDDSAEEKYQRDLLLRHHDLKRTFTSHGLGAEPDVDVDEDGPRKKMARGRHIWQI